METTNREEVRRNPGIYVVTDPYRFVFVEVETNGTCHQLKPATLVRDGELSWEGWQGMPVFYGPLARKETPA